MHYYGYIIAGKKPIPQSTYNAKKKKILAAHMTDTATNLHK